MAETVPIDPRPSPTSPPVGVPQSPRPSAHRRWRCISIAAGPISASSNPMAWSSGKVTAFRAIRAALPTCGPGGASGSNRRAVSADADYVKAKTEMLQLRLMEKRRELVRQKDVNGLVDGLCGVVLTHLSSMPARCPRRGDLATRRSIERVVFEVRTEIANICQQMADKNGEPRLDEQ